MKKKQIFIYAFMIVIFALSLFMLLRSSMPSFKGLSASVSPEEEKNIIMEAAKKYIEANIDKFDGASEITIQDLIDNKYLVGDEINDVTNDLYDVNTRVYFSVSDKKISDIYMKSEMFRKLFKCDDVCYLEEDKYIYHEDEVYKILKVDSAGYTYIMSVDSESISVNSLKTYLSNRYNNSNKGLVKSFNILNKTDIENSKIINIEDDMLIDTNVGYKKYNINSKAIVDVSNDEKDEVIFVIKLNNTINYEIGSGTKFNPYVVSE